MIDLDRSPLDVAPDLLGTVLRHGPVAVRLTEVEAYLGPDDPASHAFRGPTPRTRVMFGPPGHLYVYLSYGMHLAANIVCDADGRAGAVLLRAGEVVDGLELARQRRTSSRTGRLPADAVLARGPGCLGQVLGLALADSGAVVGPAGSGAGFELGDRVDTGEVSRGPRVGVSVAEEEQWRFWLPGEASVSRYQRSPRAPRAAVAEDARKPRG